jgi:hypothetical protein
MTRPEPEPTATEAAGAAGARRRVEQHLKPMNDEIVALVNARGGRDFEDLVPEVEAVMRRYGVAAPGRDGILQWIEDAAATADYETGH